MALRKGTFRTDIIAEWLYMEHLHNKPHSDCSRNKKITCTNLFMPHAINVCHCAEFHENQLSVKSFYTNFETSRQSFDDLKPRDKQNE